MLKFTVYIVLLYLLAANCQETGKGDSNMPSNHQSVEDATKKLANESQISNKSQGQPKSTDNLNQQINEPHQEQEKVKPQLETTKKTEIPLNAHKNAEQNFSYMYLLTPVSLLIIGLIIFRTMRLKKTRAEIKYGNAERTELRPLPMSLDDSSDENEDNVQTLFDINQLRNSRSGFVA